MGHMARHCSSTGRGGPFSMGDMTLLRCHREKRNGDACGRFLGQAPTPVQFDALVSHTRYANEAQLVVQCRDCGSWNAFDVLVVSEAA